MEDKNYKNPSPSQSNGEWKNPLGKSFLSCESASGKSSWILVRIFTPGLNSKVLYVHLQYLDQRC